MSYHTHHLDKWLYANLDLVEESLETRPKALVVLAGASSSGKSFCAKQLKDFLSHHHHKALVLSLDQYDFGLSGIIPNKVQENEFKGSLENLPEIESRIRKVIYNVPFDKKYDESVLPKIEEAVKDLVPEDKMAYFLSSLHEEWLHLNFDEPSVYNLKEAAEDLKVLYQSGKIVEKVYSKVVSERVDSTNILNGRKADTLIVEGIYGLSPDFLDHVAELHPITNFIDGNPKSLFLRRILRDAKATSAGTVFTMSIYFKYIIKSYKETILPGKQRADVLFDNEMSFGEMRSGDLYTTKEEKKTEDKAIIDRILKSSKILSKTYQKDILFRVPGEEEKSENILRLRCISPDEGKTYTPISLVHKGPMKERKDNKIIRPINVLIHEGQFNQVFKDEEDCLNAFRSAGFLISKPRYKIKYKLLYKNVPYTLRLIDNVGYIEYDTKERGDLLDTDFFSKK